MCAARQAEILDNAALMLKPGGRLVYSTCTFAPEENEETICRFLHRHENFYLEEVEAYEGFLHGNPLWAGEKGEDFHLERSFRIMPHKLEGEGHFIAVLKKEGERGESPKTKSPSYLDKNKEKLVWKGVESFLRETIVNPEPFLQRREYVLFADQLFLLPPEMPDMRGLKIVRPGLHLGTVKKERLEPSHALALALLPEEVRGSYELPPDSREVLRFLKGEALSCDLKRLKGKEKGWTLMCTGGFSLGWCKLAGGTLKNHYPKGLRWMQG